jgi:hypothetical protein
MNHRAPLVVAIFMLLLPVIYVGSYFALVVPEGKNIWGSPSIHYRWGERKLEPVYYPLEQLDRRMRPLAWQPRSKIKYML